jgi:hypothetical protein
VDVFQLCELMGVAPPLKRHHTTNAQRVDGLASSDGVRRMLAPPKQRILFKHNIPANEVIISSCCAQECYKKVSHTKVVKLRKRARECCVNRADKNRFFRKLINLKTESHHVGHVKKTPVCRKFIIRAVGGSAKIIDSIRMAKPSRWVGGSASVVCRCRVCVVVVLLVAAVLSSVQLSHCAVAI